MATARRAAATSSRDRKSTRLNSSHLRMSYAVFCLKKQIPANQSQAAGFIRVPVDILRVLGSMKHRAPSAGGARWVKDRDQSSLLFFLMSLTPAKIHSLPI